MLTLKKIITVIKKNNEKIYLSIYLSVSLNGQVINRQEIGKGTSIERNTIFNLEELKVRWKKAALENCPGVSCPSFSAPGPCSSIVATPTGPSSASVSFVPPTSDGGSLITGYTVTATSTPSAPAKRKSSSVITVTGTSSPIVVTGLIFGVNYIFSVVATNAAGGSPPITTTTTVTPCTLNTAGTASSSPTLTVNTALTPSITISTTGATGIGTATNLPTGVTAVWASNVITISGTPSAVGTFNYIIPLTGTSCSSVNATGTITVVAACAAGAASSSPTLTVSTVMTNITHTTTIATGIGTATNLPTGVTAVWASNVITISGTPSAVGTFNYIIPLTGTSCSSVNATGTITVSAACAAAAASTTPTLTVNTVLTNITHGTTSATGIGTASGLPTGVSAAWSSNTITISGTPSTTGTFNYTIPLTGTSCSSVNATGTITVTIFTCGSSTISDIDNNVYNTVSIGTQCWTNTNLKVTKYSDNTSIPLNNTYTSGIVSTVWAGLTTGAYTIYGNEASSGANATNYGFLYNWYAAKGIATTGSTSYKNICPTGYHVPTDSDWNKLVKFIDSGADTSSTSSTQSTTGVTKLIKSDALWSTNIGTDDYGFSGLPGGYRFSDGSFKVIRNFAFFWSAAEKINISAWYRFLYNNYGNVYRNNNFESVGASVRCLRD